MAILDFLFPIKCLECGKEGDYLCLECVGKTTKAKLVCPYCERSSIDGTTHFKCKRKYGLDGLTSLFRYEGVIRKAIIALKYKYAYELVSGLADHALAELKTKDLPFVESPVTNVYSPIPILVPVPLHWYRDNYRGFNQSEEIGKIVAEKLGWKFAPDLISRRKLTIPQVELKAKQRVQNIRGAFALNPNYPPVPNAQCLILFDDVWTTGSTMKEAALVLKRSGIERVWGLTLAR